MKTTKSILLTLAMLLIVGCAAQAPDVQTTITPTPAFLTLSTIQPSPISPALSAMEQENFYGNTPCSWPCWQGITPGITSGTEAIQRLNDSPLVLKNSINVDEPKTGFGSAKWYWKINDKQALEGNMEWRNGVVLFIALTDYHASIGEIINRFGPPENIEVINCALMVEGPQRWCATLYYAKNGFEIHYNRDSSGFGDDIQIMPSDPINFVMLFKPSTIEDWILSMGFDIHPDLRDWKGYGNLLDLYYYRQ